MTEGMSLRNLHTMAHLQCCVTCLAAHLVGLLLSGGVVRGEGGGNKGGGVERPCNFVLIS